MAVTPGRAEHYTQLRPAGFRRNSVWAFAHATGASNVVTTLEDLARWDGNLYTERVGGPGPETRDLTALDGVYRSDELDVAWTLAIRDGQLTLRRPRFPERVLAPADRDAFRFTDTYDDMALTIHLAFGRDLEGRVAGFRLTTSRVANLEFTHTMERR